MLTAQLGNRPAAFGPTQIAMICASAYLLVLIRILLVHFAERILLLQPTKFGGDYRITSIMFVDFWALIALSAADPTV